MGDQNTTQDPIGALDRAMAEAITLYDVASKHGAPVLQARLRLLIAHLRAAQKAVT